MSHWRRSLSTTHSQYYPVPLFSVRAKESFYKDSRFQHAVIHRLDWLEMGKRKKTKRSHGNSLSMPAEAADAAPPPNKRLREDVELSGSTEPASHPTEHSNEKDSSKKKKKKKHKKKKKKKPKKDEATSPADEAEDEPILEGSMIDGQMILIDRANKKVFSGLEVLENGDRKQIGVLDGSGMVQLYPAVSSEPGTKMNQNSSNVDETTPAEFPFETDADDHCESPCEAYADIVPFLEACGGHKGKENLSIYDPYYCNGAVVKNLGSLGFPKVYNRKEDCYKVWADPSRLPPHDILVTNPPYSGDHIERLIRHITSPSFGSRPWMLLLPQWVHKKDYYMKCTSQIRPFYIVPKKRYVYVPPPSFREAKKSDVHKKSSPFCSMWFVWGGSLAQTNQWLALSSNGGHGVTARYEVARSKSALRDLRRKGSKTSR